MNILYICADHGIPILGRKGASIHIRELTDSFIKLGHNVVIASPLANKSNWQDPEELSAKFLHLPLSDELLTSVHSVHRYTEDIGESESLSSDLRRILYNTEIEQRLIKKFRREPPDFIYVRASLFSTAGVNVANYFNVPLFVELNAPLVLEQSTYRETSLATLARKAENIIINAADQVFVVSDNLQAHVKALGADEYKIHTIPNGVNPEKFFPKSKDKTLQKKYCLHDNVVIGFVGGLRPWHGVLQLPELMSRLVKTHPSIMLLIVGDGPLQSTLRDEFDNVGLTQNVIFINSVLHADIPNIVRLFDIALAPYPDTEHEFYFSPLKIFEYMGCGVPTVAAEIGQISQLIDNNITGFTYSAGNIQDMTDVINSALSNQETTSRVAAKAAREIHARYTWDINAERILTFAKEFSC